MHAFNRLPIMAEQSDATSYQPPTIGEFFPEMLTDWGPFSLDRIMVARGIVVVILILGFWLIARRASVVPSRPQAALEFLLGFVRVNIAEEIMGKERAKPYIGVLTTVFFTIFAMNLAGIVPGINMPGTGRIGLPLLIALWVFVVYLGAGIKKQGLGKYLKSQLFPPGVPWPVYVLITPIEILQVFVLRPLTLAVRLLANMMAGHLMLVLCFGATHYLLLSGGGVLKAFSILPLAGGIAITVFEIFVGFLQAYIFTLLSSIYLNFALEEQH